MVLSFVTFHSKDRFLCHSRLSGTSIGSHRVMYSFHSRPLFYTFDSHLPIALIFNCKFLPITSVGLLPNKLSQLREMDFSFARWPAFITQDVKTARGALQGLQILGKSSSEWFGRSQEALHPVPGRVPVRWHSPVWLSHASLALIFKVTYSAQANPDAFLTILCRRSDGLGR